MMKIPKYSTVTSVIATVLYMSTVIVLVLLGGYRFKLHLRIIKNESEAVVLQLNPFYTIKDVALRLDNLTTRRKGETLHIAFIGDSLVRDQFTSLLMVPSLLIQCIFLPYTS